jgi:hypothetical protein
MDEQQRLHMRKPYLAAMDDGALHGVSRVIITRSIATYVTLAMQTQTREFRQSSQSGCKPTQRQ